MNSIAFAFRVPARAVASVTILALLAWTLGLPAWIHKANAANVTNFSATLSDSDLGAFATSTIRWTTSNGMVDGQAFTLEFVDVESNGSDFSFAVVEDNDIASTTGATINIVSSCPGVVANTIMVTKVDTTTLRGEACGTVASSSNIGIVIGGGGTDDLTQNPTFEGSYVLRLQGDGASPVADTGDTRVYIIDDVTVTATVETVFEFSINAVLDNTPFNGDNTATTSTATLIPFGVITPGVLNAKVVAQELTVETNALNGFSVTVEADQTLTAGNGATIDTFEDGGNLAIPGPWSSPGNTVGNVNEYGHWGLSTDDEELSGPADPFATINYAGNFVGNPVEVFWHDEAVTTGYGTGLSSTLVGYKVEITSLQEAANDYTATLTYVATPLF